MKRNHGPLVALGIVVLGLMASALGGSLLLPRYIEARVVAEAKTRGIQLTPGELSFGWQWLQLSSASVRLIGAPSIEVKLGLVDFELKGAKPVRIELSDVQAGVSGSLPRVLLELGEWTRNYPEAYALPIVASRVSVSVAEVAAGAPWLEVSGGFLTRTVAGAAFSAESCRLSGFELGKVGAGFSKLGSGVSIGFGDQSAQAAPLRLDASMDANGGLLGIALTPTKLGLLAKGLGLLLPLPEVVASGKVELRFPPGELGGEAKGNVAASLQGFVPPHPPELDGFVFGDVTTFDAELLLDAGRNRVTLSNAAVKAGKFVLIGEGSIVRDGQDAGIDLELKGVLPCDALAGAAAESRLGQLLGRVSGRSGKRAAQALIGGQVSVQISVHARMNALLDAQLTQKIGVGCGLKPLTLQELLRLTPNARDLQGIGNEVGKQLEDLGRDLGLPRVPDRLTLPSLPALPPLLAPKKKDLDPGKKLEPPAPIPSK